MKIKLFWVLIFITKIILAISNQPTNMYIANFFGNSLTVCPLGNFEIANSCKNMNVNNLLNGPGGILFTKSHVYITNSFSNSITECYYSNSEIEVNTCQNIYPNGVNVPVGIALSNNKNYIYIANTGANANSYTECKLNADGIISATDCSTITPGITPTSMLSGPNSIVFSQDHALITDYNNNSYTICNLKDNSQIDPNSCNMYTAKNFFNAPSGVALNNGFVYIANYTNNSMVSCRFNGNNPLKNCKVSFLQGLLGPSGITLNQNSLYIADLGITAANNKISVCRFNDYGVLGGCFYFKNDVFLASLLNGPFAIAFH